MSPKVTGGLLRMRQETYRDRVIPAKYKLLTAMAISIAIRCEPCIRAYVKMAFDNIEFLEVAMTMQGRPGEDWALKAWSAYKACRAGMPSDPAASCCSH